MMTPNEIQEIKHSVINVEKSVHRIENCLLSDEGFGRKGLVEQVKSMDKKLTEIDEIIKLIQKKTEIDIAKKTVWAMLFGAIGAVLLYITKIIIENLFNSHH